MNSSVASIVRRAKKASPEEFLNSSIIRFSRHDNYIQEKLLVDFFAIKGNLMIIEGLRAYIKNNLSYFKKIPKIKILDVGPAIGALSTLLVLQLLEEFSLMDKASIYLLDASQRVIDKTCEGSFVYPSSILNPTLKNRIMKKIRNAKGKIGLVEEIPWKNNSFNITIAGFLFHHLHKDIKPIAAKEISRVLLPNGFLGVAEEWFDDYGKDYAKFHKKDKIPLAYEDIISYENLSSMLPNIKIFFTSGTDYKEHSYTFCGTKTAE